MALLTDARLRNRVWSQLAMAIAIGLAVPSTTRADYAYVANEVVITFAEGYMPAQSEISFAPPSVTISAVDELFALCGAISLRKVIPSYEDYVSTEGRWLERTFVLTYSEQVDAEALAAEWEQLQYFDAVSVNQILDWEICGAKRHVPGDTTMFAEQWYFDNSDIDDKTDIDMPEAWEIERGQLSEVIAIFDEGTMIETYNPNLWNLHSDFNYLWISEEDVATPGSLSPGDIDGVDNNGDGFGTHAYAYKANIIGFNLLRGYDSDSSPEAEYNRRLWYGIPHSWRLRLAPPPDSWEIIEYSQHGVWVASLAAGKLDGLKPSTQPFGKDIVGAAPNCSVYWARFRSPQTSADVASAIEHLSKKARIINMSFGGGDESFLVENATVTATQENDCILIAASGNDEDEVIGVNYPARYDSVLAVGAIDRAPLELADFSNWTDGAHHVDVVAPTGLGNEMIADAFTDCPPHNMGTSCDIVETTDVFDEYGTSFASPQVSGVAALVRSRFPGFTQADVKKRLLNSAEYYWQADAKGTYRYGKGKINAYRALSEHGNLVGTVVWTSNQIRPEFDGDEWVSKPGSRDGIYYVSSDLTIKSGATLKIEAGTVVKIAPDHDRKGADVDRVEILVESGGTLEISGTLQSPVEFQSFSDSPATNDDWIGIKLESGSTAIISGVVFKNALRGIENYGALTLTDCTFRDCATAIDAHANVTVSGALITGNSIGADIHAGSASLAKCTIAYNSSSATIVRAAGAITISKSVTAFNGGPAVRVIGGTATMQSSVVFGNASAPLSPTDADWQSNGQVVYNLNPQFCNAGGQDYRLYASSPAIAPLPPSQGYFGERVGAFDIGCVPNATVSVIPAGVVATCPAADGPVTLEIAIDLDEAVVSRPIAADELRLDISDLVATVFDADGILMASAPATSPNYTAEIEHKGFGGRAMYSPPGMICSNGDAADILLNGWALTAQAVLTIRSPDLNGSGNVNVQDFALFGPNYPQDPASPGDCRDFNDDQKVNVLDFSFYGTHNGHGSVYGPANAPADALQSSASVALTFTDEYPTATTHKLIVDVAVEHLPNTTALLFSLAARNERVSLVGWRDAQSPIGTVAFAPVARDDEEHLYFGVLVSDAFTSNSASLGQLVFDVTGTEPFEVVEGEFVLAAGEVLLDSGADAHTVAYMAGVLDLTFDPVHSRIYHNRLEQNFPNPFNPTTTLAYSIKNSADVNLTIYDVVGRRVRQLVNEPRERGAYHVVWDGANDAGTPVSSGVYFYKLVAGSFSDTRKMTILK